MESENEDTPLPIRSFGNKSIVSILIAAISGLAVILGAYYSNRQLEIPSFPRYAGEALQREYKRNATEVKKLAVEVKALRDAFTITEFNTSTCKRRQSELEVEMKNHAVSYTLLHSKVIIFHAKKNAVDDSQDKLIDSCMRRTKSK